MRCCCGRVGVWVVYFEVGYSTTGYFVCLGMVYIVMAWVDAAYVVDEFGARLQFGDWFSAVDISELAEVEKSGYVGCGLRPYGVRCFSVGCMGRMIVVVYRAVEGIFPEFGGKLGCQEN